MNDEEEKPRSSVDMIDENENNFPDESMLI
jgi:hypothetical protein